MKLVTLFLGLLFSYQIFSSTLNHICNTNPVLLPIEVLLKTPPIDFVGLTPEGDPVYAHQGSEVLLIYKKNFTDLTPRLIWAPYYRSMSYTHIGMSLVHPPISTLKEVIDSLGISCGGNRASSRPIENDLSQTNSSCHNNNQSLTTYSRKAIKCCQGFEFNQNNLKCGEPQLFDFGLKQCGSHQDCASVKVPIASHEAGTPNELLQTGCYQQKVEDMFNRTPLEPLQDIVLDQSEEYKASNGLKNAGDSCTHSKQCKSYACKMGTCAAPTICRLAKENEYASGNISCEYGFEPDSSTKCIKGPAYSPYIGALEEVNFYGEEGSQFEFEIPEEEKKLAIEAMGSIRAFEWLSLRLSRNNGDCYKLGKYLRENFGEKMLQKRQMILSDYSQNMNQIEKDFATLISAKNDSKELVTVGNEQLSEEELAAREANGYDTLNFMLRKALAQLDYESRMLTLMNEVATLMLDLSLNMQTWKNNDKQWQLGSNQLETFFQCDAKFRKEENRFSSWETVHYEKVKYRWEAYYQIKNISANQDYLKTNEDLRYALSLIHQKDIDSTMQSFTGTFVVFDPLNYKATGDLAFTKFGREINLNQEKFPWEIVLGSVGTLGGGAGLTAILILASNPVGWAIAAGVVTVAALVTLCVGLFSTKIEQTRKPRELDGSNNGTLVKMREAFKKDIIEHYKTLKSNSGQTYFIYEPELANFESKNAKEGGKDCLENIDQEVCKKVTTGYAGDNSFYRFMEMLTDYSMAHFLHYGQTSSGNYTGYFSNPRTARNKYFSRIAADAHSLSVYYNALVGKRQEQINALSKVINGVVENYGTEGGINLDGGSYSAGPEGQAAASGKRETKGMSKVTRSSIKSSLSVEAANLLFDGDASSTSNSSDGAIFGSAQSSGMSAISSAMSKRRTKMKEVNERAKKKGIDVDKREATRKELITARAGSFGSVKPTSSGASSSGSMGLGSAKLDAEVKDINGGLGDINADFEGSGDMKGSNAGMGGFSGISSGPAVKNDPTGLSSEDKDMMVKNVERNPSKYRPEDFDNLFEVVSKAYARSLDRILIRKKPGEK